MAHVVVVVVAGNADLFEVVGTLYPRRRQPNFLDGRQQKGSR